jgi:hypothetical protein
MDWINLVQHKGKWQVLAKLKLNLVLFLSFLSGIQAHEISKTTFASLKFSFLLTYLSLV